METQGTDNIEMNIVEPNTPTPEETPLTQEPVSDEEKVAVFETQLKAFLAGRNIRVNIMTPAYGGACNLGYVHSLINTVNLFREYNVQLRIDFCKNDSLVSRARNNLVARSYNDPEVTHMMFIDSDITWNPLDILILLMHDKELIGGAYPIKKYYWERLVGKDTDVIKEWVQKKSELGVMNHVSDIDYVKQRMLRYNINVLSETVNVDKNLMEVRHVATGFMMFKREVITAMMAKHPELKYFDPTGFLTEKESEHSFALFEPCIKEGIYYSEDWTFCERWVKEMDGKIYINVGIVLTHTGPEDFTGSFSSLL